jgi:hypothetical protein
VVVQNHDRDGGLDIALKHPTGDGLRNQNLPIHVRISGSDAPDGGNEFLAHEIEGLRVPIIGIFEEQVELAPEHLLLREQLRVAPTGGSGSRGKGVSDLALLEPQSSTYLQHLIVS